MTAKPRYTKVHGKIVADEYVRLGWTLRFAFRAAPDEEPYEYLLSWDQESEPATIDWNDFKKKRSGS